MWPQWWHTTRFASWRTSNGALQFGQGPSMTGFKGEQGFTSALIELTGGEKPKVLFTTGHGELRLDDFSPEGLSQLEALLAREFELALTTRRD